MDFKKLASFFFFFWLGNGKHATEQSESNLAFTFESFASKEDQLVLATTNWVLKWWNTFGNPFFELVFLPTDWNWKNKWKYTPRKMSLHFTQKVFINPLICIILYPVKGKVKYVFGTLDPPPLWPRTFLTTEYSKFCRPSKRPTKHKLCNHVGSGYFLCVFFTEVDFINLSYLERLTPNSLYKIHYIIIYSNNIPLMSAWHGSKSN